MRPVNDAKQVRVSVAQASTVFFDTSATIEKAEKYIAQAASEGSQMILFPEAFIGGYPRGTTFGVKLGSRSPEGRELFRKYYLSAIEEKSLETNHLANLSLKYNIFIVMGVIEREGGTLYCSVFFFDPSKGFVGKHRKLIPTAAERYLWGSGDGSTLTVIDSDVAKIGALICWENRMPLARTAMYAKGVEIYCAPTADARDNWLSSITHIALEGSCFVLSANQFCRRSDYADVFAEFEFSSEEERRDPEANYIVCKGRSAIVSPFGEVLAGGLNFEEEGIISAYLDLGDIVRAKFEFDVVGHYSRSDIFSLSVKENANQGVKFFTASDQNLIP